jgi:hypothetical protein
MSLSDNLIAYWSLDEASGNAIDAHSTNDLTETGGTITSTTGNVGNCRAFLTADTEYFELADNAALSTGDIDFTVAFWFKILSGTIATFPLYLGKWSATAAQKEHCIYQDTNANRLTAVFGHSTSTTNLVANNFGALSTDTWYFATYWHDSVNNQIGIAVNAGTADTAAHSAGINDGSGSFRLGHADGETNGLDGFLDEVGFWKRVLSSAERTELYNGGSGRDYAYITAGGGGIIPLAMHYYQYSNG